MSTTTVTPTLADDLRSAVAEIEGVSLVDSPRGNYYSVKLGSAILGYVNGSKKIRIDFPMRKGEREKFYVAKKGDIAKAVRRLSSYAPKVEAEPEA